MRIAIPSASILFAIAAVFFPVAKAQVVAPDALVAAYPLNGDAEDASGNEFDGTISGATPTTDRFGRTSSALFFNGTDAYVDLGNRPEFNFTNSFTLNAWVKTAGGINSYIVGKYSFQSAFSYSRNSYGLGVDEGLAPYGFVVGASGPYFDTRGNPSLNDGEWHVLSLTYDDAAETLRLYTDGELKATRGTGAMPPFTNSLPLLIGKVSSGLHFTGSIDDVSIYNRALTEEELAVIHRFHLPPVIVSDPNLITVTNGQSASLTVGATNSLPIVYQWYFNGVAVTDATNESILFDSATFTDAGTYTVRVTSDAGSVLSSGTVLQVIPADGETLATLSVSNFEPTNAPVRDIANNLLAGSAFLAQVYAGPDAQTLIGQSPAVPFLNGESAGYFAPIDLFLTNVVQGSTAFVQVRVWETGAGSSYEQAVQNGGQYGSSAIIENPTGGGIIPTPRLDGLTAFSLVAFPRITAQPLGQSVLVGESAEFEVEAWGSSSLTYQWFLSSNELAGANSATLTLTNLQLEHSGEVFVVVANSVGAVTSSVVTLLVQMPDTNAPVVTITSPTPGNTFEARVTLSGGISDDRGIESAYWTLNDSAPTALNLTNGQFTVANVALTRGANVFNVFATDTSFHVRVAEVVVTNVPSRTLSVGQIEPHQEGEFISVPVFLESRGDVGGLSFSLNFDRNYLADPDVQWGSAVAGAVTQANTNLNSVLLSFALSGSTLPTGAVPVATIVFRSRSVPSTRTAPLPLSLQGVFDEKGDALPPVGTEVIHGSVQITPRKYIGDNNANDRLDVGDASTIMRLANRVEIPRTWDTFQNDLNRNFQLDAGDVIRVLRAVVGLDPQPGDLEMQGAMVRQLSASSARIGLLLDKATAAPGEQVKVTVDLSQLATTVAAASFRLNYPTNALKLEGAVAHRTGNIVPASAAAIWNVLPQQNNYEIQNGVVALAVTSDRVWATNEGALAEFTFTVQAGATNQHRWNLSVTYGEVFTGTQLLPAVGGQGTFIGRAAVAPAFTTSPVIDENGVNLVFGSEVGLRYQVETSENLVDWIPLTTITSSATSIDYTAPLEEGSAKRFYRTVQLAD